MNAMTQSERNRKDLNAICGVGLAISWPFLFAGKTLSLVGSACFGSWCQLKQGKATHPTRIVWGKNQKRPKTNSQHKNQITTVMRCSRGREPMSWKHINIDWQPTWQPAAANELQQQRLPTQQANNFKTTVYNKSSINHFYNFVDHIKCIKGLGNEADAARAPSSFFPWQLLTNLPIPQCKHVALYHHKLPMGSSVEASNNCK